jgi:DNA-binding transcriptional LysR family regulator
MANLRNSFAKKAQAMASNCMDWDDLRFVLAVGRERTLSAAARSLGVNHTTVFRRVRQIEAGLGVRLFERHRDGYTPTAAGEEAVTLGERLEGQIDGLERQLCGRDTRPSGMLRVTTTDTLLMGALGEPLAAFCRAHPAIALEITAANPLASLSQRDADVAIRPAAAPPETLVGRRLCVIASAIYGAGAYLEDAPAPDDLGAHRWVAPDDSLAHLGSARWLRATLPGVRPALRANTLLGMAAAARAGVGLAVLPCFLGDAAPELKRLGPPLDALAGELWLLTHRDLRHVARVRAFMEFMDRTLRPMRPLFEGTSLVGAIRGSRSF